MIIVTNASNCAHAIAYYESAGYRLAKRESMGESVFLTFTR